MKFVVLIVTVIVLAAVLLTARHFMNKNVRTYGPADPEHVEPKEPVDADTHGDPEPKEKADCSSLEKKPRRQAKKKQ